MYREDEDYYGEDIDQEKFTEDLDDQDELKIPDVYWKDDIEKIEDVDLQLKEFEKAEKIAGQDKVLRDRLDRGEIDQSRYDTERQCSILPKMRKAATRCGLESVGLTYDHLGDLTEDVEFIVSADGKNMNGLKDRLKETIDRIGPDQAQKIADRMRDDEEISQDTHDRISRQVRLRRTQRR